MSKNKDKTYTQVMNEWAAQRSFIRRTSTGLLCPAYGVTGMARVWGWIWRLCLMLTVPVVLYLWMLRTHGQSADFTTLLASETKRYLGADTVTFQRARWDLNGELRAEHISIKGAPENIFTSVAISNLSTTIPMPDAFRSEWHLKSVDAVQSSIELRAGSSARPVAAASTLETSVLAAGWGLNPDGSKLTVDRYQCDKLTLRWGSSPSTKGELVDSAARLTRTAEGWEFLTAGGIFQQCWLDRLRITDARILIGSDKAVIEKGDFMVPGGGSGSFTGTITFGESPEIKGAMKLENIQFHPFLPDFFHPLVNAVCHGSITVTGSTNRSTGIIMDTNLTVQSGTLRGIPVFRALELTTGETSLAQPEISGGRIHFISQGSQESGGVHIEADDVFLDCGTRMKIGLTMRHERKQVMASTIRAATTTGDSVAVTTSGVLRIGLPPETIAKFKPSIRQEFITREDQGYHWMDVPYRMEEGEFTKEAADRMIALHYAGK